MKTEFCRCPNTEDVPLLLKFGGDPDLVQAAA
jgi:hypothetical protein